MFNWETIIVILIVVAMVVLVGRSLYRTLKGKNPTCSCGSKPNQCPTKSSCKQNSSQNE